jgi:hypothetical protein
MTIQNRYINEAERSFTIIAFPTPDIGGDYEQIFREVIKLNTLDYTLYRDIQQKIIDALDMGEYAVIKGRGDNRTNLTVSLHNLTDPKHQTKFENCVADVNIPVGEVFTSPEEAVAYRGVFCHSNVRKDKFDLPPEFTLQIQDALNEFLCGNEEPVRAPEPEHVEESVKETPQDEPNELVDTEADTTGPDEEQVPPTFWERVVAWLSSIFNRQRQS